MGNMKYKNIILIVVLILLIIFVFLNFNRRFIIENLSFRPFKMPVFTLQNTSLKEIPVSNYHGKPIVIIFWATWCPSCKNDINFFNTLKSKYSELEIIAIALDDSLHKLKRYLSTSNMPVPGYEILVDSEGSVSSLFEVYNVPETFLINSEGMVIHRYLGTVYDRKETFLSGLREILVSD